MKEKLIEEFKKVFLTDKELHVFFAPGRVNLIGEHTDYNGGHVFPCALTIGTYSVFRKRSDKKIRLYSMNFEDLGVLEYDLDNLPQSKTESWTSYPLGIVWSLEQKGFKVDTGFDMLFFGNIPNGSGLSSSASIEVATTYVLKTIFGFNISNVDIAKLSQFSENEYNKVNCGIMDQFAVAMGKEDCAIYLDTNTLEYSYAPVKLQGEKIVIMNTNKRRELGDSKYNERRSECQEAVKCLQTKLSIETLGELSIEEFEANKDLISSEILQKRAKHAVYENQRTIQAVDALKQGDLELFGKLMVASHDSLRDDYEVTGKELDTLVAETLKCDGVVGARMTGAGFGGCAVSIVKNEAVEEVIKNVGEAYEKEIGYPAEFYVVSVGNGPCEI